MINAKDLKVNENVMGIRLTPKDSGITLSFIKGFLLEKNEELYGYPIEIVEDKIKSGGLFNAVYDECLVITNTEHRTDYFKFVICLRRAGNTGTITCHYYGNSELTYKKNRDEDRKNKLTGMIANSLFGVNQAAFAQEYDYYNAIDGLFNTMLD